MFKIAVAGTGYVGLVAGACFAERGHQVICVDVDERKVETMKQGICPIYEQDLEELMQKNYKEGRLDYTTNYKMAYKDADAIFIGVGTPEQPDGSANLSYVATVSRQIAENIEKDCLVVVKSTVPIGTNDEVEKYINAKYATDARCVGSVPTVENGVFINKDSETAGPVTMQFPYNGSTSVDCKGTDTNYTTDESQLKSLNLWITGESYWLTSRDVASTDSNCAFCMRLVNNDGTIYDDGLCLVENTGNAVGYLSERGLRLCILLKSNVKITGGDGSVGSPYTIN